MTWRPAAQSLALGVVCAWCTACAPPLLKLPTGPGEPAPDAQGIVAAATAACRPLSSVSMEMAVSGSMAGGRVRGRLVAGLTRAGEVRLEAVAPAGQPLFLLTNGGGGLEPGATLLLPRDNRVLERGQFDAVLEAVTGIPIDAPVLFAVLTGCTPQPPGGGDALGGEWRRVRTDAYDVYVRREKVGPWRLTATATRKAASGWRAEYRDFQNDLPHAVRLVSARPGAFDLQIALSQLELNPPLGPDVFTVRIPASAAPITLDELKTSGPLGADGR